MQNLYPDALDPFPLTISRTDKNAGEISTRITLEDVVYALKEIETKLGITGSSDTASVDYVLTELRGLIASLETSIADLETDIESVSSGQWEDDLFVVTDPGSKTLSLSHTPNTNSESVYWNGLGLVRGASQDYTISGSTVTINGTLTLTTGDQFWVKYTY